MLVSLGNGFIYICFYLSFFLFICLLFSLVSPCFFVCVSVCLSQSLSVCLHLSFSISLCLSDSISFSSFLLTLIYLLFYSVCLLLPLLSQCDFLLALFLLFNIFSFLSSLSLPLSILLFSPNLSLFLVSFSHSLVAYIPLSLLTLPFSPYLSSQSLPCSLSFFPFFSPSSLSPFPCVWGSQPTERESNPEFCPAPDITGRSRRSQRHQSRMNHRSGQLIPYVAI